MRLTDLSIKTLKAPEKGAIIYPDTVLTGFGVRVSEGGTKSFVLTHGKLRKRETIGRVGVLTRQEARAEAKRRLAEYTLGKTVARAVPWNTAVTTYLEEVRKSRRERTHADYKRFLGKYFRFGELAVSEVTPSDIQTRLARLGLSLLKKWLGHAKLETTEIYATPIGKEERRLARLMWRGVLKETDEY
jgi:hypothetical protein